MNTLASGVLWLGLWLRIVLGVSLVGVGGVLPYFWVELHGRVDLGGGLGVFAWVGFSCGCRMVCETLLLGPLGVGLCGGVGLSG